MAISGELLSVDLSNVFQMLSMNRKRGVLHVRDQENILKQRSLVIEENRIGVASVPAGVDAWALLVDSGDLAYETFEEAQKRCRDFKVSRDQLLRKKGVVDEAVVAEGQRRIQEELVLEIFLWREISFSLEEDAEPPASSGREMFNIDLVVMEAARRQDEWLRAVDLLGGEGEIWGRPPMPSFATQPATDSLTGVEKIVLDHVDGVRGTDEIMGATSLPRYHVDLALCRLMQERLIRRLDADELLGAATDLLAEDRSEDAIRLLERAQLLSSGSIEVRLRLAEAHLARNAIAEASEHYKVCAEMLRDLGRVREAVDIYHDVVRLVPTDFATLKTALEVVANEIRDLTPEDEDIFNQGIKLFRFHLEASRYDEADELLGLLIEISPNDVGLNLQRAKLLTKTGYVEEGVDIYVKVAGRLMTSGELDEARGIYRTVLGFDLFNQRIVQHCRSRLEEIDEILARRQRRRAVGVWAGLAAVILLALGAVWFAYQDYAETRLEAVQTAQADVRTVEGWRDTERRYRQLSRGFPLTSASSRAAALADEAGGMVAAFRAEEERREAEERRRRESLFDEARQAWGRGVRAQTERRLRAALADYERCFELVQESGRIAWANDSSRRIGDRIESLRRHVAAEDERIETIARLREEGRWSEAFDLARELQRADAGEAGPRDALRVVDRGTVENLRMTFLVDRSPADADLEIDGVLQPAGPRWVDLHLDRPVATVRMSRAGYRPLALELDWRRDRHLQTHVLDRMPLATWHAPMRYSELLSAAGRLVGVDPNGGVHLLWDGSARPRRSWRPPRLVSLRRPTIVDGERVVLVGADGHVDSIEVELGRRVWQWQGEGTIVGHDGGGGRLLLALSGEAPRLEIVDLLRGETVAAWPLESEPVNCVLAGGGFVVLTEDGRAFAGAEGRPELLALGGEDWLPRSARAGSLVVLAKSDGSIWTVEPTTGSSKEVGAGPEGAALRRGPETAGDRAIVVHGGGRISQVDAGGRWRTLADVPALDADPSRPLVREPVGGSLLLPEPEGGFWQLDAGTGALEGALRRKGSVAVAATAVGEWLYVAFRESGDVEVFSRRP